MASTVTVNIVGDASSLQRALGESETGLARFSTRMQQVGTRMISIGSRMTLGITAPLALLGKVSFDAASDLTESMTKVDVVFAENARVIKKWSEDAAENLGISRQKALEAAGTFGNLFRALGVGLKPATDMSKKLVQLSSDLASFNNVDPEEALLALRSGLVGEVEPLRRFGVSLSAARVEAKALEMGLVDVNGEVTDSGRVAARYAIIMEDTALAQGDFARTADGAANKQRTLKAQFQDTAATLGKALLPIFQDIAVWLQKLATWFTNLSPTMQKVVVVAGLLLAVAGPLTAAIGALVTVVGLLISPVGLVVLALAAVVAALILVWTKWDEIWGFIKDHPAIAIVVGILAAPVAAFILIVGGLKKLYENWDTIWGEIQSVVETVWSVVEPIFNFYRDRFNDIIGVLGWLKIAFEVVFGGIQTAVQTAWEVIRPILRTIKETVGTVIDTISSLLDVMNTTVFSTGGGGGRTPTKEEFDQLFGKRASGGPVWPGTWLVGERGPELLTLGSGQRGYVTNAQDTAAAMSGGGGGITLHVTTVGDGDQIGSAIIRRLRRAKYLGDL